LAVNGKASGSAASSCNIGEALDRRDPATKPLNLPAWMIADRHFMRSALIFATMLALDPAGSFLLIRSDLARRIDIPARALERTVARFNEFSRDAMRISVAAGHGRYKSGAGRYNGQSVARPHPAQTFLCDELQPLLGTRAVHGQTPPVVFCARP
jgi:hypothetical protein